MTVQITESDTKGSAYIGNVAKPDAEMTFSKVGSKLLIINHTEVKESLRGQGVGRKLLDEIVKMARARQSKILPLCPYAKSVFEKEESIKDVLK